MSEITDRIKAEAKTDWPALCHWLATRSYPTPERYKEPPDLSNDDGFPYTDGTWDEVNKAANTGLLTDAQYIEVCKAADAYVAARKK